MERNHLCNFERGHHGEQKKFGQGIMGNNSLKIFEFGPVVQEMSFRDSSYMEPFVQRSRTICAILVEGIKRNNSVKLF